MTIQEIQLLKETLQFISLYKSNDDVRETVESTFRLNGKSVMVYVSTLVRFSPKFYQYYKDAFAQELGFLANKKTRARIKDLDSKLWNFFDKCLRDQEEFTRLVDTTTEKISGPSFYSAAELQRLQQLYVGKAGPDAIDQFLLGIFPTISTPAPFQFTPKPKIVFTTEQKEKAAYSMAEKIRTHGADMTTKIGREKLIKAKIVTKAEMNAILESGLVKGADVSPKFNKQGFTSDEQWNKAVYEAAEAHLEGRKLKVPPKSPLASPQPIRVKNPILPRLKNAFGPALQNTGSRLSVFAKRNLGGGLFLITGGAGAALGSVLGPAGTAGGAFIGGYALPKYISGGGGRTLLRLGNRGLGAGTRVLQGFSNTNFTSKIPTGRILLGLLLMFLGIGILASFFSGGPKPPTGLPTAGGGSSLVSSDISQCKFTRGGDSMKELAYKSPLLLSYIQEASSLTGIPSVVIAAFMRVETPATITKNDDQVRALSSTSACPRSITGALGVMQLQPKGTRGHAQDAVANGAQLISKSYDELTEEDYCDVRKNIIMGAGFILKKMELFGFKNGGKWNPAWTNDRGAINTLVEGYYGCLNYGGADPLKCDGPFNYGLDVWTSVQSCKPTTSLASAVPGAANSPTAPTAPTDAEELRLKIASEFGIEFEKNAFSHQTLRWSWEVFHQARYYAPNFFPLVHRPFKIVQIVRTSGYTATYNGIGVITFNIRSEGAEDLYKQILIHELGHIIHGPSGIPREAKYDEGINIAQKADGQTLSRYSNENTDEAFAELVSYYITRGKPEQRTFYNDIKWSDQNPLETGNYPAHLSFIEGILGKPSTAPTVAQTPITGPLSMPTKGTITLCYGATDDPYSLSSPHKGIDFANVKSTPVYAVADGEVRSTPSDSRNGNYVIIDHPQYGIQTQYLHLLPNFHVSPRDKVTRGSIIGFMDASGFVVGNPPDHLHFLVIKNGAIVDPSAADLLNFSCREGIVIQ